MKFQGFYLFCSYQYFFLLESHGSVYFSLHIILRYDNLAKINSTGSHLLGNYKAVNSFINIHYCNLNTFYLPIDVDKHCHLEACFGSVEQAVVVGAVEVGSGLGGAWIMGWIACLDCWHFPLTQLIAWI